MNTLRNTVLRLQHLSVQAGVTSAEPGVPREENTARLDALVAEMEHMASDPLFMGRPLGQAGFQTEWVGESPSRVVGLPLDPADMIGVEILSGRFESTNDRLQGVYEDRQMRAAGLEWSPGFIRELLGGHVATPSVAPMTPFSLSVARGRSAHTGMQFPGNSAANEAAEQVREQIVARVASSFGAQANTPDRIVRMLTR